MSNLSVEVHSTMDGGKPVGKWEVPGTSAPLSPSHPGAGRWSTGVAPGTGGLNRDNHFAAFGQSQQDLAFPSIHRQPLLPIACGAFRLILPSRSCGDKACRDGNPVPGRQLGLERRRLLDNSLCPTGICRYLWRPWAVVLQGGGGIASQVEYADRDGDAAPSRQGLAQ